MTHRPIIRFLLLLLLAAGPATAAEWFPAQPLAVDSGPGRVAVTFRPLEVGRPTPRLLLSVLPDGVRVSFDTIPTAPRNTRLPADVRLRGPIDVSVSFRPFSIAVRSGRTEAKIKGTRETTAVSFLLDTAGQLIMTEVLVSFGSDSSLYGGMGAFDAPDGINRNRRILLFRPDLAPSTAALPSILISRTGAALYIDSSQPVVVGAGNPHEMLFPRGEGQFELLLAPDRDPRTLMRRLASRHPTAPPGRAFFLPWFSTDRYTPDTALRDLMLQSSRYNIAAGIMRLVEWSHSPFLQFLPVRTPNGVAGIEETSAFLSRVAWVGSGQPDFNGLRATMIKTLNASANGIQFTASDIAGNLGRPSWSEAMPPLEVLCRWIQGAAFSPMMQWHIRAVHQDPYDRPSPLLLAQLRDYAWMHRNLLPYLLQSARRDASDGMPLVRPLYLDDPSHAPLWNVEDQYLLGPDLLVAPVVQEGVFHRSVDLPSGEWIDYWTDRVLPGRSHVARAPAPPEVIPVFVRAGTALPLETDSSCLLGGPFYAAPRRVVRLFAGTRTAVSSRIIEYPEGDTIAVTFRTAAGGVTAATASELARPLTFWIPSPREPRAVRLNGRVLPASAAGGVETWSFDHQLKRILVHLPTGRSSRIEIGR